MGALAMAFDLLDFAKEFERFGLDEKQAQVQARVTNFLFDKFQERFDSQAKQHVAATSQDVKAVETELCFKIEKLQHETELEKERIHSAFKLESEKTRAEIEKVRSDLTVEIEKVRSDLSMEIEKARSDLTVEIEKVRVEIYKVKSSLIMWMLGIWGAQTAFIVGLFGKALNLF